jgi:hypothetical protein
MFIKRWLWFYELIWLRFKPLSWRQSISLKFALIMLYLLGTGAYAQTPAQCDTVYAVHDKGIQDSQIFSYHLDENRFQSLGSLHTGFDLEGFEVHPSTHVLYASSGQLDAKLYTVDAVSGALEKVGDIGFDNVKSLAFHPLGQLWAGSDQGLLKIDVDTGIGAVFVPVLPGSINSLAWNREGTRLYATTSTSDSSTLWVYNETQQWQIACEDLPKKVESLETLPDGSLVYGFHHDAKLGIHFLEVNTCQISSDAKIDTPFNDIEGIAWSALSCNLSNLDFLRAYLENLEGVEAVDIQSSGAIRVTMNGEVSHSQLAETVTSGEAPTSGELIAESITDQNGDGTEDFQITYPSGERQVLYYYGVIDEAQDETQEKTQTACQTLEIPAIDPTATGVPSSVIQSLYTGDNPVQTGVESDAISLEQAAVIHGMVTNVAGEPLTDVNVSLKEHPEYGQTVTTCDGYFNMVANGGDTLTINYQKAGYLPVQRNIETARQQYAVVDTIVMRELDPAVTHIDLTANTPIQVAQGSVVTDEAGTRQAMVLFPQGVTATMTLPDGSTQALTQLDVRATEYTVGENKQQTLPALLPPDGVYDGLDTYAVELSVDQAIAAGATQVNFSQPVMLYVDNFLEFPVGINIPMGWYDSVESAWVPSDDGRVISIIGIENGLAVLDVDGNGQAASASALAELGITEAERQQLASHYAVGKSLWRFPITHFTPFGIMQGVFGIVIRATLASANVASIPINVLKETLNYIFWEVLAETNGRVGNAIKGMKKLKSWYENFENWYNKIEQAVEAVRLGGLIIFARNDFNHYKESLSGGWGNFWGDDSHHKFAAFDHIKWECYGGNFEVAINNFYKEVLLNKLTEEIAKAPLGLGQSLIENLGEIITKNVFVIDGQCKKSYFQKEASRIVW